MPLCALNYGSGARAALSLRVVQTIPTWRRLPRDCIGTNPGLFALALKEAVVFFGFPMSLAQ